MARQGNVTVCLFLGTIVLGCSGKQSAPVETNSQVSQLVGKNISVAESGNISALPFSHFLVRDCDAASGTLCLSPLVEKDRRYWVHPSKFGYFTVLTEQEAKDRAAEENKEMVERRKQMDELKKQISGQQSTEQEHPAGIPSWASQ